jgi:hypothetical protein
MRAIIIVFAVLVFSIGAHAQACGAYYVHVKVTDNSSHPLKNAEVKLSPITKDETHGKQFVKDTDDPSAFTIKLTEGESLTAFHKLSVTAPGFDPAELQVTFLSCSKRSLVVELQKPGTNARPVWHFENDLTAEAEGPDGQWIKDVTLRITNADTSEVVFDQKLDRGYQGLTLPNGTYLVEFKDPSGQLRTASVDLTALENRQVKLKF